MDDAVRPPDERKLRSDLAAPAFVLGAEAGRWRLVSIAWPNAVIAVTAARREESPKEFFLRFDLTRYPLDAPTATPWDPDAETMLPAEKRPKGNRVGMVFRSDWESGKALYIPCDRVAFRGHEAWAQQHSQWAWAPGKDITLYLRLVHQRLNDPDYLGVTQ
jgi:hypothetical protein